MILPKESTAFSSCRFNFLWCSLSRTRVISGICQQPPRRDCRSGVAKTTHIHNRQAGFLFEECRGGPQYFPESMSVYDALDIMKAKRVNFAIVCGEFGDMAGVVTPSDILSGLVGEMPQQTFIPDIIKMRPAAHGSPTLRFSFMTFLNSLNWRTCIIPRPIQLSADLSLKSAPHTPIRRKTHVEQYLF